MKIVANRFPAFSFLLSPPILGALRRTSAERFYCFCVSASLHLPFMFGPLILSNPLVFASVQSLSHCSESASPHIHRFISQQPQNLFFFSPTRAMRKANLFELWKISCLIYLSSGACRGLNNLNKLIMS